MNLKIDHTDRVVLLGGGRLLLALARWCQSEGAPISVVTAPRHAAETIEHDKSLMKCLSLNIFHFCCRGYCRYKGNGVSW